jgi:hypothetical protein
MLLLKATPGKAKELSTGGTMAGKPIEVAYYYRIKWGYHEEFIELFKKNHYPVLKAQIETGRILEIRTCSQSRRRTK